MALYVFTAIITAVFLLWSQFTRSQRKLSDIPAVTTTVPILATIAAFQFLLKGRDLIQKGYKQSAQYKGRAYRVPELFRWHVIVTGPQMIDELRKCPDDILNMDAATAETLQVDHTLGPEISRNPYHVPLIRNNLTRNLASLFSGVLDEIVAACHDNIPSSDDWVAVPALNTMMQVVCRASNRIFVGLPKCRDPDYIDLNIHFTVDVVKGAFIINMFPKSLRPLAARLFTNVPGSIQRGIRHLEGIIRERFKMLEAHGTKWDEKPNDMLSWLMDAAEGGERGIRALVLRVLALNFSAIHTSSMSVTQALFHLAANAEYARILREEIEEIVAQEGWSKDSIQRMRHLDSFLKESQRYHGLATAFMSRIAKKDFTFSDGTFIPAGTFVSVPTWSTHHDEEYYDDPDTFNPWRFISKDDEDSQGTTNNMAATSPEYLPFGYGKHACPGRFFAANELKIILAHLVLTYDIKLEGETDVPEDLFFATAILPNPSIKVAFRRRND
ncbi:cytochrome P450 [Panus rudis PR-1116 ss-1]|nr:cytochrome P450 [Panus rudis PR-1116 ss-1]